MGRLSDKLKTQLSQDYFQYNFQNIGELSKLRTYIKLKLNLKREDYLDIEDISLKHRKLFCSFKISCHDLDIERGRYCRPSIALEDRIFKICTETFRLKQKNILCYFVLNLENFRLNLIRNISEIDASIYNIPHSSRFTYNQNVEIIKLVMHSVTLA